VCPSYELAVTMDDGGETFLPMALREVGRGRDYPWWWPVS